MFLETLFLCLFSPFPFYVLLRQHFQLQNAVKIPIIHVQELFKTNKVWSDSSVLEFTVSD